MSLIKKIRAFVGPRSVVTFQHLVSEKDQITANWYVKDVQEVHHIGEEMRKLFDTSEAAFKAVLKAAQAEVEADLARKNKKGNK